MLLRGLGVLGSMNVRLGEIVAVGNQAFWGECLSSVYTEVILSACVAQEINLVSLTDCRDLSGQLRIVKRVHAVADHARCLLVSAGGDGGNVQVRDGNGVALG